MLKLLSSLTALVTFLLAVLGMYDIKDNGEFNNKNWMSQIDGSAYISEISIPGTHDSAALYEPLTGTSKCQDYTVRDQLDMGVRFLDIRICMLLNKATISHGVILQGQDFAEIVDACLSFLEENPTETIVFSVMGSESILSEKTVTQVMNETIAQNSESWYTENRIPTLDEVRGKIVLFNRYDDYYGKGLNAAHDWIDNSSFGIYNNSFFTCVQDHYNLGDKANIEQKWNEAKTLFNECVNERDASYLYLNFMSGHTGSVLPNVIEVASVMNEKLINFIDETGRGHYGIVIFDFVNPQLCEKIIQTNF